MGDDPVMASVRALVGPTPGAAPPAEPITPEVVTPACPGCRKGETPHRDGVGRLGKGHTLNTKGRAKGSTNTSTKAAAEAMRKHAAKAVATLVKCLDDPNPWVHLTAARTIVERCLPAADFSDPESYGPAIILPPGTRIDLLTRGDREALVAARRPAPPAERGAAGGAEAPPLMPDEGED